MNEIEWYKQYAVERAIEAEEFENALQNERIKDKIEEVSINEIINIDFIKCEILGVKNPEITNNAFNNSSMVIKMLLQEEKRLLILIRMLHMNLLVNNVLYLLNLLMIQWLQYI